MRRFLNPFFLNLNQLPAAKKGFKNYASHQTFGPSYFDRTLKIDLNKTAIMTGNADFDC